MDHQSVTVASDCSVQACRDLHCGSVPTTRQQRITLPASFWRYEQMWTKNTRIRHSTSESSG